MKLTKEEHRRLLHALIRANNAFHESLHKDGFSVSYSLLDTQTGSIFDETKPTWNSWPMGTLTIKWKLNFEREAEGK